MGIIKNLAGTSETTFRVGGPAGPRIKNNSDVVEARNSDDNAYAVFRCATPVADNDAVTKYYADSIEKPLIVKRQADCSAALPTNTAVRGWVVVTTAGTGAVIGDILYDNGTSTGDMTIVAAIEGRAIGVTDALTGGTITLLADVIYIWDADASVWTPIGGPNAGAIHEIRFALSTSTKDSTASIPANAYITEATLIVSTPYSAGATIALGSTSTANKIMLTTDNNPQVANTYVKEQDTAWESSASVVRATITNTPGAGVGVVIVKYSNVLI